MRVSLLRVIQSLYDQSKSSVCKLGSKSDWFGEGWPPPGLHIVTFCVCDIHGKDLETQSQRRGYCIRFGKLRVASLLFANGVVLMEPLV